MEKMSKDTQQHREGYEKGVAIAGMYSEGTLAVNGDSVSELEDKVMMPPPDSMDISYGTNTQQPSHPPLSTTSFPTAELHDPILLGEGAITLTPEEKLLFSALEAASQFHFETHETADFSPSPSASEASSTTVSRTSSVLDMKARQEKEELQKKMVESLLPIAIESNLQQSVLEEEAAVARQKKKRRLNIRVAGGWVRDKLLGLESDDIDVALDDASGVQFAHMVRDYLEYVEEQVKLHTNLTLQVSEVTNSNADIRQSFRPLKHIPTDIHHHHRHHHHKYKIGVIAANPNQSKHLETATMKIFGLGVDFVNLRAEEQYLPNSRIPVVKHFGTPYEDAMRRDFTINSLFYNIQTRCIEDFSHRGIHDLKRGIIVTPLSPFMTFHDDPLRVLRAIRFAVRFEFDLAEELRLAAQSRRVHESLICKVSRERVGTELEGMLTGKAAKPLKALQLISELGLSDSIFLIGAKEDPLSYGVLSLSPSLTTKQHHEDKINGDMSQSYEQLTTIEDREHYRLLGWEEAKERTLLVGNVLDFFNDTSKLPHNSTAITTTLDERLFLLSTYLSPFKDLMWTEPGKAKVYRVASNSMLKEGIKFKNGDVNALDCILSHVDSFRDILHCIRTTDTPHCDRLQVGILIRDSKQLWITALLLAAICEIRLSQTKDESEHSKTELISTILRSCETLYTFVAEQNLDECWKQPLLLNGKEIMKALDLGKRGGPIIGSLIEEQWKWILTNPQGTKCECEDYLKQTRAEVEARFAESNNR